MSGMSSADPRAGLKARPRIAPKQHAQPRRLTDKQRSHPLLAAALERLQSLSSSGRGMYLRRLDTVHDSGRRTRSEVFQLLAKSAEQILARLDLATGVLGYLDADGSFRLFTQRNVAIDGGVSTAAFNRALRLVDRAGYAVRRIERIAVRNRENGAQFVRTRVLVMLTEKFFRDLGLAVAWKKAQTWARKRRARQIAGIQQRSAIELQRASSSKAARQRTKQRVQDKAAREEHQKQQHQTNQSSLRLFDRIQELQSLDPGRPVEHYKNLALSELIQA